MNKLSYNIPHQRITNDIYWLGGGMANNLVNPITGTFTAIDGDMNVIAENLLQNLQQTTCAEEVEIDITTNFRIVSELMQQDDQETDLYFYHGDHTSTMLSTGLGSSSWITDGSGNVNQHLAYMPFGESFIDQRNGNDFRFKFTGKERDAATGFDYTSTSFSTCFGARYYSSDISVWLSVDPLASQFPSLSPYAYVANNPNMLKDPDGRDIVPCNDKASGLIRKSIRRVFGSDRIADEIFIYKNGNITTKEKMAGMSFRKFKRKLNRSARKHKGRRGKKKYSKEQLQATYSIYQKVDSEKNIVVTAVSSYSMIQGDEYYNSTNSSEKSNYKVSGSEAKNLVNEFIKIEDHSKIILSLPLEMGGGRENRDVEIVNNKTAYLGREIPNGIKIYPSGNMIIDITHTTKRNEVGVMIEALTK